MNAISLSLFLSCAAATASLSCLGRSRPRREPATPRPPRALPLLVWSGGLPASAERAKASGLGSSPLSLIFFLRKVVARVAVVAVVESLHALQPPHGESSSSSHGATKHGAPGDSLFFHYSGHRLQLLPAETSQDDDNCILPQEVIIVSLQVYEITRTVSSRCFKCYDGLSPMQKVELTNRGFSTFHALVAAAVSFYLVMMSGLFNEDVNNSIIIDRKSWLSDSMFGVNYALQQHLQICLERVKFVSQSVSIGYFLTDLAMILWHFPSLGGKEFLLHHGLSMFAICLALFSGKAHMYILMVLFTEATTPFVNLRWYLDVSGQKTRNLYLYNGLALFAGWLALIVMSIEL